METPKPDPETMIRILKRLIDGFDVQSRTKSPGFQWSKSQYAKMPSDEKNLLKSDLRFMLAQHLIEGTGSPGDVPPSFRVTDKGEAFIQSILKGTF